MPRPCSEQSASINKGLAAPRSILIFKLTAERIRALPCPLAGRGVSGIYPRSGGCTRICRRVFVSTFVRAFLKPPYSPSLSPPVPFHFSVALWHSRRLCRVARARARSLAPPPPTPARVCTHSGIEIQSGIGRRYTRNLIINKCK